MPGDIKLFKIRLTQLNNTLLKRGRISKPALFSAFNLNEFPSLKQKIIDVFLDHGCKIDADIINLEFKGPDLKRKIKELLNYALPVLLESFKIKKEDLPRKKDLDAVKPSAVGLFSEKLDEGSETDQIKDDFVIIRQVDGERVIGDDSEKIEISDREAPNVEINPIKEENLENEVEQIQPFHKIESPARPGPKPMKNVEPKPPIKELTKPIAKAAPRPQEKQATRLKYEFYVCNKCGAETSKLEIMHSGNYLECPKCYFQFSPQEASLISKTPEEVAPVVSKQPIIEKKEKKPPPTMDRDQLVRPSQIFKKLEKKKDPLVKPSELFGPKQPKGIEASRSPPNILKEKLVQKPAIYTLKPSKPSDSRSREERLVRPSEILKQKATIKPKKKGIKRAQRSIARDKQEILRKERLMREPLKSPEEELQKEAKSKQPGIEHLVKPSEFLKKKEERDEEEHDACPKCGHDKYSKVTDRSKIISYNPLMYGHKKKCLKCSHVYD